MRFRALVGFSWFLLTLASCADEGLSFRFEGDDESFEVARSAAQQWETVCGVSLPVSRSEGRIALRQVAELDRPTMAAVADRDADGNVTAIRFRKTALLEASLAHEFGHALGIKKHTPDGIMRQYLDDLPAEERRVRPSDCPR